MKQCVLVNHSGCLYVLLKCMKYQSTYQFCVDMMENKRLQEKVLFPHYSNDPVTKQQWGSAGLMFRETSL